MAGLATLEFPGERLESSGLTFNGQLFVHSRGKPVQLFARHAIFVFGVVFRINLDGPEGDDAAVNHHADILAVQSPLEPRAQILPGGGHCECFHNDILMSLTEMSSAAPREPARDARLHRHADYHSYNHSSISKSRILNSILVAGVSEDKPASGI